MQYFHKKGILWLLLTFFCMLNTSAQDIQYQSSLGGSHSEYLFDAIPTPDGGFLIGGSSISNRTGHLTQPTKGDLDYWICKMDANNNLQWQKSYGGNKLDLLQSVKSTTDGGYILAGISSSDVSGDKIQMNQGSTDFWVVKIDSNGGIQWQNTIGGNGQEKLNEIKQTSDGGYIIAGSSSSKKNVANNNGEIPLHLKTEDCKGGLDFWIVKLKSNGEVEFQKTLGGKFTDELKVIQPLSNNEYLLGGYSNSPESGDKLNDNIGLGDYWILKVDQIGNIIWQQTLGGSGDDVLTSLIQTNDGGFIIGGNSGSEPNNSGANNRKAIQASKSKSNTKGTDFWLLKLNEEGITDWQETYNFGDWDALATINEDKNGSLLISGYAQSESKRNNVQKSNKKSPSKDEEGINDYIAFTIDSKGEKTWSKVVGSRGDEVLRKIIATDDGGYLLAGTSNGGKSRDKKVQVGGNDYWVVKLKNTSREKLETILKTYPNPTTNATNVEVNFEYQSGTATLYDLNGRKLNSKEIRGEKTIPFNLSNLPEGMYLINIKTNNGSNAVKVIKR